LSERYRITANAAYQKHRRGVQRRNKISPDEILPSFHGRTGYRAPKGAQGLALFAFVSVLAGVLLAIEFVRRRGDPA
jgi:hypothetical protein